MKGLKGYKEEKRKIKLKKIEEELTAIIDRKMEAWRRAKVYMALKKGYENK